MRDGEAVAANIIEDLQATLEQFSAFAENVGGNTLEVWPKRVMWLSVYTLEAAKVPRSLAQTFGDCALFGRTFPN